MISIIITSFKEPETIGKALEAALNQKTSQRYNIIVSAPDEETLNVVRKYQKKNKKIKIFKDPGKGKMHALNLLFKRVNSDILILTDGDVWISKNSVEDIANMFSNPEIGCISGRPVPVESRKGMYGYWANFLFDAAHKIRKGSFRKREFVECSGYLFSFRKDKSVSIPLDTAEDAIIPYHFWEKGYKIGYVENAEVYVKNVNNWKDWISQKVRTSKAHETLEKYADTKTTKRVKSFGTEISGTGDLFNYAKDLKEFYWSSLLALARFYMWILVLYNSRIKKFKSVDNWERVESTKS